MIDLTDPRRFHLCTDRTSCVLFVGESGHLLNLHYGAALREPGENLMPRDTMPHANQTVYSVKHNRFVLETSRLEYSGPGRGDYRDPSCLPVFADGSRTFDAVYRTHRIVPGKPPLEGLPSVRGDGDTLEIELEDRIGGLAAVLSYTAIEDCDALCRSVRLVNEGGSPVILEKAMSACMDLEVAGWDLVTLDGSWIRERHPYRRRIGPGRIEAASRKGTSSADHSPFLALLHPDANTHSGEAYGAALVYSGSHVCSVETSPHGLVRVQLGIHPEGFRILLEPGETFQTPEAVFIRSGEGINGLSACFHRLVDRHIIPNRWRGVSRPILVNNWEATYMDFSERRLLKLAGEAAAAGAELFVLDDGWFGRRDSDDSSLGDWFANRKKLPGGLKGLSRKIRSRGLKFGIWIEPEMISEDSDLCRAHPDWLVRAPGRDPSPARNQYLIDMVNPQVRDCLFDVLSGVLRESEASYVKWDMNRNVGDAYSPVLTAERQGEFGWRYMLGVYDLMNRLTAAFPDVLFESCASGGNRFDLGMLHYMPQVWTSDNSDAGERLDIQEGTSWFAPPSTMGAHVSAVPSHQTLRRTPIETRFNVAAFGVLGYELDLNVLTPFEKTVMKRQIEWYREHRAVLQFGQFYKLEHPESPGAYAWMTVSEDRSEAVLGVFRKLSPPNPGSLSIRLRGLDRDRRYRVETRPQYLDLKDLGALASRTMPIRLDPNGRAFKLLSDRYLFPLELMNVDAGGDELMAAGLRLPQRFHGGGYDGTTALTGDFASRLYTIRAL